MCDARIRDGVLVCQRPNDGHETGHVFQAAWAPDAVRDEEVSW